MRRRIPAAAIVATALVAGIAICVVAAKLRNPQALPILASEESVLAVSPDGNSLAVGAAYSDFVNLYNMQTGRNCLLRLDGKMYDPLEYFISSNSVAFSSDGNLLVCGGTPVNGAVGENGSLNLWDTRAGKHLGIIAMGSVTGPSVVFSPDGKTVACGGEEGNGEKTPRAEFGRQIRFWSVPTGKAAGVIQTPSLIAALAYSPDGKYIASGGIVPDPTVRVWNVRTHRLIWSQSLPANQFLVTSMQFSPDGSLLATGSQTQSACLWVAKSGKLAGLLAGDSSQKQPGYDIADVAKLVSFSPDGKILAIGGRNGITLWSVPSQKKVRSLMASAPFAFLPDGEHLLTLGVPRMRANYSVWDKILSWLHMSPSSSGSEHVLKWTIR